jgi:hypothetical protein
MEVTKAIKNSDDDEDFGNSKKSTKNEISKNQESGEEESEEEEDIYENLTNFAEGHSQYGYQYK